MAKNKAYATALLFDRLIIAKSRPLRAKILKEKKQYIEAQAETFKITGMIADHLLAAHISAIYKILTDHYQSVMGLSYALSKQITRSKKSQSRMEIKFEDFEYFLMDFVTNYAAARAKDIGTTTQDDIKRAVVYAYESNLPEAATIKQILRAKGVSAYRADTIARTETHLAAMYAHRKQIEQYAAEAAAIGVTVKKRWIPVNDSRTRQAHKDMANTDAIGINEYFVVGGEKMWGAGDPNASAENVINCRCVIVTEDDF